MRLKPSNKNYLKPYKEAKSTKTAIPVRNIIRF